MFKIKRVVIVALLAIIVYSVVFNGKTINTLFATTTETYENLRVLSDVITTIQKNYVDETDLKKLIYDSITGMVSSLDPHSSFMPPEIYQEMQVETKGEFGGLGIEITMKDGVLTVVAPIEDTPASRAGIAPGDRILKIDNQSTKNLTLMEAVKKMRGKPGEAVTITVDRDTFKQPEDFTIERAVIKIQSVRSKLIEDTIGYIRISQFQESTSRDFKKALNGITASENAITGLVIDLRNNAGGLLDQAVQVADEFLDGGLIVYTEGRSERQQMQFSANPRKTPFDYPTIALVNGGSASGSEIVAGALQDHRKAIIVGTQTFGKGTVQTIFPLTDGSGLRLTTAQYYTPNHRSIQEKGIMPDIIVEEHPEGMVSAGRGIRFIREKDIINQFEGREQHKDETPDPEKESKEAEQPDYPLQTAITILKSWELFQESRKQPLETEHLTIP